MARKRLYIEDIKKLPKKPGVYFLKNEAGSVFYIGKANNLRSRVATHSLTKDAFKGLEKIHAVEWIEMANEIEALIREREYIQHYQPKLNVDLRDDKQYLYVGITLEEFPRIFTTHQPTSGVEIREGSQLKATAFGGAPQNAVARSSKLIKSEYIGPFTDARAVRDTLHFLRKPFPYYATNAKRASFKKEHSALPCSYCHLGLCPGPAPKKTEYRRTIATIKRIFSGKHKAVLVDLKKRMREAAQKEDFEKAAQMRNQIEALESIFTHHNIAKRWEPVRTPRDQEGAAQYLANLIGADLPVRTIEGYDISNIQGAEPVASMVRFDGGTPNKSLYRKFNIQLPPTPNDFLMMREAVRRRFSHNEWSFPDLILIDGGRGQLNSARVELLALGLTIPIVSLAKKLEELYLPSKPQPILLSTMPKDVEHLLRRVRDEAHRFAITHHRGRHRKTFRR